MNTLALTCPDCYAHWLVPFQPATPATRNALLVSLRWWLVIVEQAEREAT